MIPASFKSALVAFRVFLSRSQHILRSIIEKCERLRDSPNLLFFAAVPSLPQPLRRLQLGVDRSRGGGVIWVLLRARASADSAVGFGGDAAAGPARYDEQGGGWIIVTSWILSFRGHPSMTSTKFAGL